MGRAVARPRRDGADDDVAAHDLGADLAGAIGIGDTRTLDLDLRLGWQHDYADTSRPITAALSGAPFAGFTVYGATPQRDAAVIGFTAKTQVAAATQLYLSYDGDIGTGVPYFIVFRPVIKIKVYSSASPLDDLRNCYRCGMMIIRAVGRD